MDAEPSSPLHINWMSLHRQEGKSYSAELVKAELEKMGKNVLLIQPGTEAYREEDALEGVKDLKDLTQQNIADHDIIMLEHPALLEAPYSKKLASTGDLNVIVNWSGRVWGNADTRKLDELNEVSKHPAVMLLNGADLDEMETLVGDIPKERSLLHQKLKDLLRFQFTSSVASAS